MKTCPSCNKTYDDDQDACPEDGERLVASPAAQEEAEEKSEKVDDGADVEEPALAADESAETPSTAVPEKSAGKPAPKPKVDFSARLAKLRSKRLVPSGEPAKEVKPAEKAEPAEAEKPSETAKPAEEKKPSETAEPAGEKKPSEEAEPAEAEKPSEEAEPAEAEKPSEEAKPAGEKKPAEEAKPAEEEKPAKEAKPAEEEKPGVKAEPAEPVEAKPASEEKEAKPPKRRPRPQTEEVEELEEIGEVEETQGPPPPPPVTAPAGPADVDSSGRAEGPAPILFDTSDVRPTEEPAAAVIASDPVDQKDQEPAPLPATPAPAPSVIEQKQPAVPEAQIGEQAAPAEAQQPESPAAPIPQAPVASSPFVPSDTEDLIDRRGSKRWLIGGGIGAAALAVVLMVWAFSGGDNGDQKRSGDPSGVADKVTDTPPEKTPTPSPDLATAGATLEPDSSAPAMDTAVAGASVPPDVESVKEPDKPPVVKAPARKSALARKTARRARRTATAKRQRATTKRRRTRRRGRRGKKRTLFKKTVNPFTE